MKILVVGGGGREHAIIKSIAKEGIEVFCAPGNGGISKLATCVPIEACDVEGVVSFCLKTKIDLCIVAPDDPLVLGMVDALEQAGIRTFGPSKNAAIIEGSKAFAKQLMSKYGIPTANYKTFTESHLAINYVKQNNKYPIVIKASGLALGKGVIIAENFEAAQKAILDIMEQKIFGTSGNEIVIEEFLTGTEVSVLAFTDGTTVKPLTSAKDHKRVFDGDLGQNTGGMGVIAPNPVYTEKIANWCMENIFIKTVNAMNAEGRKFKGVLYFGLIITNDGAKVIEYNCRFGDPEAQACLSLLQTDLLTLIDAVIDEKLSEVEVVTKDKTALCVMMVSGGYPNKYAKNLKIEGLDENGQHNDFYHIFHSGTTLKDGEFLTNGGRVLGITVVHDTLSKAQEKLYKSIDKISFTGSFYRHDIGGRHDF